MANRNVMEGLGRTTFTYGGVMREVYTTPGDEGPGVLLMHELPGLSPGALDFAEFLADEGFRVFLPIMFGKPGQAGRMCGFWPGTLQTICVRAEFLSMQWKRSSPITEWMRGLARHIADETDGPIGMIGMCLTGGFAMSMVWDESIGAGVAAQPSIPISSKERWTASDADMEASQTSATPVLAIRFENDLRLSPQERLDALEDQWEPPTLTVRHYEDKWKTDPPERRIKRCENQPHATLTAGFDRAVRDGKSARLEVLEFLQEHLT